MANASLSFDEMHDRHLELKDDLLRVALRDGWDRALMAIGWLHLGFFAANQWAAMALNRNWPHLLLWPMEVLAVAATLRLMLGAGWSRATPLAGVLVRVWITFLILAFNAATLNGLTGLDLKWYFLVWAGLSTFGFATSAWLCHTRFLIPAVFMYFVGLAMANWIAWSFLIHAFAWWAALQGIGLELGRVRRLRDFSNV